MSRDSKADRPESLRSMNDCVQGMVYKLRSRNLNFGVYAGNGKFIGIREKLNYRYLAEEYHWDWSPRFGTVTEVEDTGIKVPSTIKIISSLGIKDSGTNRWITFVQSGCLKGHWQYVDSQGEAIGARAMNVPNSRLFHFLDRECEMKK